MSEPRQIPAATFTRIAKATLGRMACRYVDPTYDDHDHNLCLKDDEAYAAHLILGLLSAVARNEQDKVMDRLTHLMDSLKR